MKRTELRKYAFVITFAMSVNMDEPEEAIANYMESFKEDYTRENGKFDKKDTAFIEDIIYGVHKNKEEIDSIISGYSEKYSIERLSKVALAALRVCIYEIKYREDIPNNVSINEALNIVGAYDDESTKKYVNGVLGSFVKELSENKEN
ncbi:MAG: transcription antitermination factor NusB [Clostridia bacterium]|nr:transcription antitermination factor NusB [Clostridia bacterium]